MKNRLAIILSLFITYSISCQCVDGVNDCDGDAIRYGEAAGLNNDALQVTLVGRSAGLDNTGEANSFLDISPGESILKVMIIVSLVTAQGKPIHRGFSTVFLEA